MAKKSKSNKSNISAANAPISPSAGGLTNIPIPSSGQGWFSQLMTGKDPQFVRADILSQLQNQLVGQAGQTGLQHLQGLLPQGFMGQPLLEQTGGRLQNYNPSFGPLREQAVANFNQQTIPSLAERFTGMGGQNSSAFQQALGGAGAGLNRDLAAMEQQFNMQNRAMDQSLYSDLLRGQLGQQGINQGGLQSLFGLGMTPQFQNMYLNPGGTGLLGGLAQIAGQAAKALPLMFL